MKSFSGNYKVSALVQMVSVVYLLSLVHESVSGFQAYPVFSLSRLRGKKFHWGRWYILVDH